MSEPDKVLCRLDDLDDPGSAGFVAERNGVRQGILVVRQGRQVFAYVNSCPHIGAPLDWRPGHFLDMDKRFILCANHNALFRIEDGLCLAGPCAGKSLEVIPISLSGEM
ncbi:MAG: Rieske (2Fe-2S) protein, partial [Rhodospirillales bacterium]|nr:Rieske (2Fe-2S) protein [Rhodospirillales bacterium]